MSKSSKAAGKRVTRVRVQGFGRRLGAAAIDAIIVAFFSYVLAFGLSMLALVIDMFNTTDGTGLQPVIIFSTALFSLIYYVGFWATSGQTIGKSVLGMTIVDAHGGKLGWGKAFLRYVGYLISALIFGLGFLWIAFDKRRQGLHDKLAGTFVTLADDDVPPGTKVEFVAADPGQGWIWAVVWAIVAIGAPVGAIAGWFVFGPTLSRLIFNVVGR